jgi:hypothetical protein
MIGPDPYAVRFERSWRYAWLTLCVEVEEPMILSATPHS